MLDTHSHRTSPDSSYTLLSYSTSTPLVLNHHSIFYMPKLPPANIHRSRGKPRYVRTPRGAHNPILISDTPPVPMNLLESSGTDEAKVYKGLVMAAEFFCAHGYDYAFYKRALAIQHEGGGTLVENGHLLPHQPYDLFVDGFPFWVSKQMRSLMAETKLPHDVTNVETFRALRLIGKQIFGRSIYESEEDVACTLRRKGIAAVEDQLEMNCAYMPIDKRVRPIRRRQPNVLAELQTPYASSESSTTQSVASSLGEEGTPTVTNEEKGESTTQAVAAAGQGGSHGWVQKMKGVSEESVTHSLDALSLSPPLESEYYFAEPSPMHTDESPEPTEGTQVSNLDLGYPAPSSCREVALASTSSANRSTPSTASGSPFRDDILRMVGRRRNWITERYGDMSPAEKNMYRYLHGRGSTRAPVGSSRANPLTDKDVDRLCHPQ
jgi:hypothetical protein